MWDYERGDIVCPKCGTVVERIYVPPITGREEDRELLKSFRRPQPKLSRLSREYLRILHEIKSNKRLSSRAYIDSAKLMDFVKASSNRVKVIRVDLPKPELLKDPKIKAVLKIVAKYPSLHSRTDRAKVAIALIIYSLIEKGRVNVGEVSRSTGLSRMHVRRLIRLVSREDSFLKEAEYVLAKPAPLEGP